MTRPSRIIFWQNMLAIHQSAHIRALAERPDLEVTLVVDEALSAERRNLGWSEPDFGRAKIVVGPERETIECLVEQRPSESVHIFSGTRYFPTARQAFAMSRSVSTVRGIFAEARDGSGIRGAARWCLSAEEGLRFGRDISFVLAAGELGVCWFRAAGFPEAKLYPYGYWVEDTDRAEMDRDDVGRSGPFEIVFVGQFIRRKGIDLLLEALAGLKDRGWKLSLIGGGACEEHLRQMTARLGLADRVCFSPALANREALAEIARHDLLVLPSRFDGWGAVVNEALMNGVPVVCSSRCGAADLLREPWRGEVFPSQSVTGLRAALDRRIAAGQLGMEQRERIHKWAGAISGSKAAEYLLSVIESATGQTTRPEPPWRSMKAMHE